MKIVVKISPKNKTDIKTEQPLFIKLKLNFKSDYPKSPPDFSIEDYNYLSNKDLEEIKTKLEDLIRKLSLIGEEMILQILILSQDFINEKFQEYCVPLSGSNNSESIKQEESNPIVPNDKNFLTNYKKLLFENKKLSLKTNVTEITISDDNFNFGAICGKAKSRFKSDFEILAKLGEGGGGVVYKVKNNYDTYEYAIKKIKININDKNESNRIIREIMLFSRLQHNNIAKYLQAWIEEADEEDDNILDNFDYNKDLNEATKNEIDKIEEISSNSQSVEKIESDSNVVFERSNEGINMWDENHEDDTDEKIEEESEKHEMNMKNKKCKEKTKKHCYLYIQMEFCEGQTLREAIASKSLNETNKWDIISSLIDVINYIHEHKLIHRDIKPSNIFLDKDNNVKLGDFGLATLVKSKNLLSLNIKKDFLMSKEGDLLSCGVGTMYYCSPEQEKGRAYDEKTDMFSLGIVIFELFYNFGSLMHRDIVLRDIREKHTFPQEFIKNSAENVM